MITKKINIVDSEPEFFETGFVDRKGRKIGYRVLSGQCDFVEIDPKTNYGFGYMVDKGSYFTCKVSKTKDGKLFGASQPTRYFKHEYQRDDEIKRRREVIIKNAVKGF